MPSPSYPDYNPDRVSAALSAQHWRRRLEVDADRAEIAGAAADVVAVYRADAANVRALAVQLARRVSAPLAAYLATATDAELAWLLDEVAP